MSDTVKKMSAKHRHYVHVRRVDECSTLDELFTHCLPSFGGAFLRRIYQILDRAIGMGCPLTVAVSGPVTVSGQHHTWLIPLLETGWVAYLSTTDAVCYHDQDRFVTAVLALPEFQRKMAGTELRFLLGKYYAAQEQQNGVTGGLLSTCYRAAIPIFVGAPGDGSVFLNSMKLWAMREAGLIPHYAFLLDLHPEGFSACAYHRWGLFDNPVHALGTLILGGGVPKNYNLQPEPALGQVLGLPNVRGYQFDVQIVTAPVTDGSLSSCPPAEAVTWGKVDKDTYLQTTESLPADYSMMMPFIMKALMEKHGKRDPYRLYENRERLVETLRDAVRVNREWLMESLHYPLA